MTVSRIPAVAKDASLIVIDANRGLGNGLVFPAGPLRAPLQPQLARTDALIMVGNGTAADGVAADIAAQDKPVLRAHLMPNEASVAALRGKRVLAFAGIGDPARFFGTLTASGVDVVRQRAFADHHAFSQGRDRQPDRRGRPRGADAGDDGKGSGAAATRRRIAGLGESDRAVRGDAGVRGCRGVAEIRDRSAFQGAREEIPNRVVPGLTGTHTPPSVVKALALQPTYHG